LHLAGLDSDSFDSSLNKKMKIHDDDLLPWERKKNKILKKQIQNFIKLGKNKLNKKNKKPIKQKGNDLLCCNCFLDCLDKIKNCFPDIYYLFSTKTLTLQIYASNLFIIFMHSSKVFK
jgi:cytochrome c